MVWTRGNPRVKGSLHKEESVTDDELPLPRTRLTPPPLDRLGVAELQAYISELQSEIARAEAEIARKQDHRNAADSIFRQR